MSYFEERMAAIRADRSLVRNVPVKYAPLQRDRAVGYIYFVRMGAFVKIGFTVDVAARLKAIQTSSPEQIVLLRIESGTMETERAFHHRFRRYKANGEWFALQGWLATFLKDCAGPVDVPPPIKRPNFFDAIYPLAGNSDRRIG